MQARQSVEARYPEARRAVRDGTAPPRVVRVLDLFDAGLSGIEIARALGYSKSYVYGLLSDPFHEAAYARRSRAHGTCVDCGGPTKNGGALRTPKRCQDCAKAHATAHAKWSADNITAAIRDWVERYGEPPKAREWAVTGGRVSDPERAAVIRERWNDRAWPHTSEVQRRFGSWNAGLAAAGVPTRRPGEYDRKKAA